MLNLGREEEGNWINGNSLHDAISTNHRQHVSIWPLLHPLTSALLSTQVVPILHTHRAGEQESIQHQLNARTLNFKVYPEKNSNVKVGHSGMSGNHSTLSKEHTHARTRHKWPHTLRCSITSMALGGLLYHKPSPMFNNWSLSLSAAKRGKRKHHPEEEKQDKSNENTEEYNRNTCNEGCGSKPLKHKVLYTTALHSNQERNS